MKFTQSSVKNLSRQGKGYWLSDEGCGNLRLFVGATGPATYYVRYYDKYGKQQSRKLGSVEALTVSQAREMAGEVAYLVAKGEPVKKERYKEVLTLGVFLQELYFPSIRRSMKSAEWTIKLMNNEFGFLYKTPVSDLSLHMLERWQNRRMDEGSKAASINRMTTTIKSALNWGVRRQLIPDNPIRLLKSLPETDSKRVVRYLSPDERDRLEKALDARASTRGKFPEPDFLKPAVLLSLNTGIRRGALFSLTWNDVNLADATLTLRGETAKNGKTLRIPINDDAVEALLSWREQNPTAKEDELIFPSPETGGKRHDAKRAWLSLLKAAGIDNFRWHDMRHDFASQLVMRGVDLTIVCELMNHSDLKLTMRYAHLAPECKLNAVQVLNRKTKDKKVIRLSRIAS